MKHAPVLDEFPILSPNEIWTASAGLAASAVADYVLVRHHSPMSESEIIAQETGQNDPGFDASNETIQLQQSNSNPTATGPNAIVMQSTGESGVHELPLAGSIEIAAILGMTALVMGFRYRRFKRSQTR